MPHPAKTLAGARSERMPAVDRLARRAGDEVVPGLERPKLPPDYAARPPEDQSRASDLAPGAHVRPVVGEVEGRAGAIVLAGRVDARGRAKSAQVFGDHRVAGRDPLVLESRQRRAGAAVARSSHSSGLLRGIRPRRAAVYRSSAGHGLPPTSPHLANPRPADEMRNVLRLQLWPIRFRRPSDTATRCLPPCNCCPCVPTLRHWRRA
jgi:hypothetical protein